ncbi:hypothetical protein NDU88_000611 [Pleurodeles waltl]|uniref:Uncharacterized protein n=1 Tax=Pleurodeles waltl TaxID=8319 RepID=A0AAV7LJ16_PLEWA|nr:hypothetical protein NDU88_000611 [Pleurodeles waltl]
MQLLNVILLTLVAALIIVWLLKLRCIGKHLPPGPHPLPLIGNLWELNFQLHDVTLTRLAKTYGNIFTLWLGKTPMVVLHGFKSVKEALISHSEEMSGRPTSPLFKAIMGCNCMQNGPRTEGAAPAWLGRLPVLEFRSLFIEAVPCVPLPPGRTEDRLHVPWLARPAAGLLLELMGGTAEAAFYIFKLSRSPFLVPTGPVWDARGGLFQERQLPKRQFVRSHGKFQARKGQEQKAKSPPLKRVPDYMMVVKDMVIGGRLPRFLLA